MRFSFLFLAILVFVSLSGCDLSSPSDDSVSPKIFDDGDAWTYRMLRTRNLYDAAEVDTLHDAKVRVRVINTNAQVRGRSGLVEVERFPVGRPDSTIRAWYRQSADSLSRVAYIRTPPPVPNPLSKAQNALDAQKYQNQSFFSPRPPTDASTEVERDTTFYTPPITLLKAPLEKGTSWIFSELLSDTSTVTGRTSIETPAGRFETVEIQRESPGLSISISDHYGPNGLVQQSVVADSVQFRDANGEQVGSGILKSKTTLIDSRP